jgi:hypothetical protein
VKSCKNCGEVKELSEFYKSKRHKDGLFSECKSCHKLKVANRSDKEAIERRKAYQKKYRSENSEKLKRYRKEYYKRNKESILNKNKEYALKNPEFTKEYKKKWASKNKEKVKSSLKKHYSKRVNKAKRNSYTAKRRCLKKKATPKWYEKDKIEVLYQKAKWLSSLTGMDYHVDHVIPINSDTVCGLNVWANLQILEVSENSKKGNSYD